MADVSKKFSSGVNEQEDAVLIGLQQDVSTTKSQEEELGQLYFVFFFVQ